MELGSGLPPAAHALVLAVAAVLMACEVLLAFAIRAKIAHRDAARLAGHRTPPVLARKNGNILSLLGVIVNNFIILSFIFAFQGLAVSGDACHVMAS
jgi:hypothetical protein